jgi:membrane-associated protein
MIEHLLHIDKYIEVLIRDYGWQAYAILFAVVFAETGLVVTPFLPGDTLLFAAGLFCHPEKTYHLSFPVMFLVFMAAAFCGDNLNYFIGRSIGPKLFKNENSKIFRKSYLDKTQHFFEKHGKKTIILARFVPIVRTFSPFVAGMGRMPYREFLMFSVIGALLWVGIFLTGGYLLGDIKAVQDNFGLAMIAMAVLTFLPMGYEVWKARKSGEI